MRVLIGEIVGGVLREGDLLPREADIAKDFTVSRGVARECVRGLEERGLVSVTHGLGAKVLPARDWDTFDPEILTALLQSSDGGAVLGDYLECRRILEVEAAGLAATRATEEDVEGLRRAFARMHRSAERARANPSAEDQYREADIAFHRAVVAASENQALGRITEPIHRALSGAMRQSARPELRFERGLPEHERILRAIESEDPDEARASMLAHLATVEGYFAELQRD
jgi:DNA-binding FadR family transcriptional regulator